MSVIDAQRLQEELIRLIGEKVENASLAELLEAIEQLSGEQPDYKQHVADVIEAEEAEPAINVQNGVDWDYMLKRANSKRVKNIIEEARAGLRPAEISRKLKIKYTAVSSAFDYYGIPRD